MRIAVTGIGSIGKRLLNLLQETPHEAMPVHTSSRFRTPWSDVERFHPDLAMICTPTNTHIDMAIEYARIGAHLWIEKPLDVSLERIEELQALLRRRGLSAYVAYPLRHTAAYELVPRAASRASFVCKSWLPSWRSYKTYSQQKATGGGSLLELSHELDAAQGIFGRILRLSGGLYRVSDVTDDCEDVADIRAEHSSGTITRHWLDIASRFNDRYISVDGWRMPVIVNDQVYRRQIAWYLGAIERGERITLDDDIHLLHLMLEMRKDVVEVDHYGMRKARQ